MSHQEEQIEKSTTPKAVQVEFTFQNNPLYNDPNNAPPHHHILPDNQRYFPQWVCDWIVDGCASDTFCVPIGSGNSLGIKESERRWQIEYLFSEGQADSEGLGPIRAHLLNQMLKGSMHAPFPPYGSLPYWQAGDAPDVSFDVKKAAAGCYSFNSEDTPEKAPQVPKRTKRPTSSHDGTSSGNIKPTTPTKRMALLVSASGPSRFSPKRAAPPPPSTQKGKGKANQGITQAIVTTSGKGLSTSPSNTPGKDSSTSPSTATTEVVPRDPWVRIPWTQAYESINSSQITNSDDTNSDDSNISTTPEEGSSTGRIARQASSKRRLQRSRSHSQTYVDERGFAPHLTSNGNEITAPPSSLGYLDASVDDLDDHDFFDDVNEEFYKAMSLRDQPRYTTGRVEELE